MVFIPTLSSIGWSIWGGYGILSIIGIVLEDTLSFIWFTVEIVTARGRPSSNPIIPVCIFGLGFGFHDDVVSLA